MKIIFYAERKIFRMTDMKSPAKASPRHVEVDEDSGPIVITPVSMGAETMSRHEVRAYFSENFRQSFAAEGVYYSKAEWKDTEQRILKKKKRRRLATRKPGDKPPSDEIHWSERAIIIRK